jgi:hypothetical protein
MAVSTCNSVEVSSRAGRTCNNFDFGVRGNELTAELIGAVASLDPWCSELFALKTICPLIGLLAHGSIEMLFPVVIVETFQAAAALGREMG